jgi:hypothetical protein
VRSDLPRPIHRPTVSVWISASFGLGQHLHRQTLRLRSVAGPRPGAMPRQSAAEKGLRVPLRSRTWTTEPTRRRAGWALRARLAASDETIPIRTKLSFGRDRAHRCATGERPRLLTIRRGRATVVRAVAAAADEFDCGLRPGTLDDLTRRRARPPRCRKRRQMGGVWR